uniref:28S ribosomal protein S14, mitochondrial isoform X3 n=1 Tax=Halichoerus grypus TaxID=9711 RepID=UPI0016593B0D|nr:28S ribosomal protein S14, mitochondrial isoform X3 [Halichoerus grypus]
MAASMLASLLRTVRKMVPSSPSGQVRGYYVDWKMLRDVKRRKMAYEYADERLRINSLRKNTILPKDLQWPMEKLLPFPGIAALFESEIGVL